MLQDRNGMVHEINLTQTGKLTLLFSTMHANNQKMIQPKGRYNCFMFSHLIDDAGKEKLQSVKEAQNALGMSKNIRQKVLKVSYLDSIRAMAELPNL